MRACQITTIAVLAALLGGCQTMTPEERRAADERQCMGYGFKRGTEGFATCLQRIDLNRQAQARADSAYVMSDMSWRMGGPYYGGPYRW